MPPGIGALGRNPIIRHAQGAMLVDVCGLGATSLLLAAPLITLPAKAVGPFLLTRRRVTA